LKPAEQDAHLDGQAREMGGGGEGIKIRPLQGASFSSLVGVRPPPAALEADGRAFTGDGKFEALPLLLNRRGSALASSFP